MFDYRELAATEGYSALFRQRAQESASYLARQPHELYVDGRHGSPAYSAMSEMLRTAEEKRIDLRLVIYPYHATLLAQFSRAGLWPLFERWKADVAALSDNARRRGIDVAVWDFACPTALTAEPVPAEADRDATMRWYWEGGHFKKELGDLVLQTVFDSTGPGEVGGFGFELTTPYVARRNTACRTAPY
jgi:hypothetical protein